MSIAIQVHDKDPRAMEELLVRTMHGNVVIDREPEIAHLSALVAAEEKDLERRRATWHWLNTLSQLTYDKDNDWSDV